MNFSLNRFCAAFSKKTNTANLSLSPCQKFFLLALPKSAQSAKTERNFSANGPNGQWAAVQEWRHGWPADVDHVFSIQLVFSLSIRVLSSVMHKLRAETKCK